jgi:serine/threonine protein kinase
VAACKLIYITDQTTEKDRKTVDKEMKIHAALKHRNILEFISAVVVEPKYKHHYVPGIYMLLEFAAGGDLFDKIGECEVKRAGVTWHSSLRQLQMWVRAKMWRTCISSSWWTGWHDSSFPVLSRHSRIVV